MQILVCLVTDPYNRGIPEIILNRMEQQGQGTGCTLARAGNKLCKSRTCM